MDFGRTKEISEVRGTSLKFNLAVRWQIQGVIYVVDPLKGSPEKLQKLGTVQWDFHHKTASNSLCLAHVQSKYK